MLIVPECRMDARPETVSEHFMDQHGTVASRVALFEQQTAAAGPAQREQPQFAVARNRGQRIGREAPGGQRGRHPQVAIFTEFHTDLRGGLRAQRSQEIGLDHGDHLLHRRGDRIGEFRAHLHRGHLDQEHRDVGGACVAQRPTGERDGVIPPEGMRVQTLQRGKIGQFLARQPVHRSGDGAIVAIRTPGLSSRTLTHTGVDDNHPLRPAHLEPDVHTGGAAVDKSGAVGHAAIPEVADKNGAYPIVTAKQVAASHHQNSTARRFQIEFRVVRTLCGQTGPIRRDLRGHTIPLTTNFDSSRPVLPS